MTRGYKRIEYLAREDKYKSESCDRHNHGRHVMEVGGRLIDGIVGAGVLREGSILTRLTMCLRVGMIRLMVGLRMVVQLW